MSCEWRCASEARPPLDETDARPAAERFSLMKETSAHAGAATPMTTRVAARSTTAARWYRRRDVTRDAKGMKSENSEVRCGDPARRLQGHSAGKPTDLCCGTRVTLDVRARGCHALCSPLDGA